MLDLFSLFLHLLPIKNQQEMTTFNIPTLKETKDLGHLVLRIHLLKKGLVLFTTIFSQIWPCIFTPRFG